MMRAMGGLSLLKGLINSLMGSWSSERAKKRTGLSLLATALMDSSSAQRSPKKTGLKCVKNKDDGGKDGETGGIERLVLVQIWKGGGNETK